MKIAIIGTGAMGSVYAGLLAAAGHEVWAIDTAADHIAAIARDGLRVSGASGDRTVRLSATRSARDAGRCDLVVIATKAMQVAEAALSARPLIGAETLVLTIQNGLGSVEKVRAVLPEAHIAVGVAGGFGASLVAPGHVHHNGWELLRLGDAAGPVTPAVERVASAWKSAGFNVRVYQDIDQLVWEKLICNVCFSGSCAVTGLSIGEVMAEPNAWQVARACTLEAYAVARARRIQLEFTDPIAYVRAFGSAIPHARPSMLLDHLARRRAEIDVINGAIPPAARACGLAAPANELVCAVLKARESKFD